MITTLLALGFLFVPGVALLLDSAPWWRRRSLVNRLRPHVSAGGRVGRPARDTAAGLTELLRPTVHAAAERLGRAVGITEPLELRLRRAGQQPDVERFRLGQLRHALIGLAGGAAVAAVLHGRPLLASTAVAAAPVLAALWDEQRLADAATRRSARIRLELPVVAEQLALLVGAGLSLPAALARLADRGRGDIAHDLAEVGRRMRHGQGEIDALREWAHLTGVDGVARLVAVLSLHREATDLAALVVNEARAARQEAHRELIETIEQRSQLVWVPVTVATLVPGLLFLAVPFVAALSGVTGGS